MAGFVRGGYTGTQTGAGGGGQGALGGGNPLQPTLAQGAQLGDPSSLGQLGQFLSPQNTIQQIMAAFAPQAANATNGLNQQLAAMGIVGGQGVGAQDQLQAQLAGGLGNSLAGAIQNSQGNTLSALGTNAGLSQQTGLANQQSLNNAGLDYAQMLQNAYGQQLQGFEGLNSAGLSGLQGLAGQGLGNAGGLGGGIQQNFPIQNNQGYGQFGQGLGSMFGGGGGGQSGGGDPFGEGGYYP